VVFEKDKHYNTKNGSEVLCMGRGFFTPFLVFQVVSGGHGIDGFIGKRPHESYGTYSSGEVYTRGGVNATAEQIEALDGMRVLQGEVLPR
jgi:hypothetical protein